MTTKLKAKDIDLLPLEEFRKSLGKYEPLTTVSFPMLGPPTAVARWKLEPGWNEGLDEKMGIDQVDVKVRLGTKEYPVTLDAILEATSTIGITKQYMSRTPHNLMQPHLNYWFSNTDAMRKLLLVDDVVVGVTKASVIPFSNLMLLNEAEESIEEKYGKGVKLYVDKPYHTLRRTAARIIIPEAERQIRPDDNWSAGVEIRNSLVGERPLTLRGYLFRWTCTNGATSTHLQSGVWNRRKAGGQDNAAYEWARQAVDEILGGLEHEFEAVEEIANMPIEGEVAAALQDVFVEYKVPVDSRKKIMENLINSGDHTWYGLMQAVTEAANDESLTEPLREALLETGGDLPRAIAKRCQSCRRIMV